MKVRIEVHYAIELEESDFKKCLEIAKENGHDFGDAGPRETFRRFLMQDGLEGVDDRLQDPNGYKIEQLKRSD